MKVLVCPADKAACGYYRLIYAAQHLQMLGHDVHIEWPNNDGGLQLHWRDQQLIDVIMPVPDADVIVFQRVSHQWHTLVVPLLRKKGVAVVMDMDDNMSAIHRQNAAYGNYHKRSLTPHSGQNALQICREATLVTVSTKNLLKVYAKHGRGHVIDNYIPEWYLNVDPAMEDAPVFGWMGTLQSHPADLLPCGKAVKALVDAGYRFRIIGPATGAKTQLRLDQEPEATGIFSLSQVPMMLSHLNVGMAPLEVSEFNSAKSRLKALEYSSLSIPYVISPREEYRRYHKESGGGFLADSAKDWYTHLKTLMDNDVLRKELGDQGRAYAATQTIEFNAWRHWEAWSRAYDIQRGAGS